MNKGALWNSIQVGPQVEVNDFGFLSNDRFSHSAHRFMRCSFRSVSVRSRLEVRFEDRFQNELECSLDHTITDGRYREDSDFSSVFRYFLLPYPHGSIRVGDQFVSDLLKKTLRSALFDGLERDPVDSRCPVVLLCHPIGFLKCLLLADVDVQPPETLSWFAFALSYRLLLRSCKLLGVFVISPLPPMLFEPLQTAGSPLSTGITPLHRYYGPLQLPLVFHRFPGVSGYTIFCSADFSSGRGGSLQLLSVSLPSCCRFYPARVKTAASVSLRRSMLLSPSG